MVNVGKYSIHVEHMGTVNDELLSGNFSQFAIENCPFGSLIGLLKVVDRSIAFCMFTRGYQWLMMFMVNGY